MRHLFLAILAFAAIAGGMTATPAAADPAVTLYNLNLRAGPGVQHKAVAVVPKGQTVDVMRCTVPIRWCEVSYRGKQGWIYGKYIVWRQVYRQLFDRNPAMMYEWMFGRRR